MALPPTSVMAALLLLLASARAAPASPCLLDPCAHGACTPESDDVYADGFLCTCESGYGGPLCDIMLYEEHVCDDTEHEHALFGCTSCAGHLGTFYHIQDTGALQSLLRSPLGQQRVRWMMEDWPEEYFDGKQTSFGLLKMPRLASQETDIGEEERICISMLPSSLSVAQHQVTMMAMWGMDFSAVARLPDGFGVDPFAGLKPGDFVVPLRFAVSAAAEDETPPLRRRRLVPSAALTTTTAEAATTMAEEDLGQTSAFARSGSFLDALNSPERGLANIFLPSVQLGGVVMNNMYLKLFWLGIGFHPPSGLSFGVIGNAICSQCTSGNKGVMDVAMDHVENVPVIGEVVGLIFSAHIDYIALRADNGNRLPLSILSVLGSSTLSNVGDGAKQGISSFLDSYKVQRLTYDLYMDVALTTPDDALDLGKLFTGKDSAVKVDHLNVRFEIKNLFNQMNVERDYCTSSSEEDTEYDFEPPRERATNLELAFSWNLGGLPLELAIRREAFTRATNLRSSRECNGAHLQHMDAQRQEASEVGDSSWWIIVQFPRVTVLQIVCLAKGIDPGVSPDNQATLAQDKSEQCSNVFDEEMGFVPVAITNVLLTIGLDKPNTYGGRQGPLLSRFGEYLGPQVSIQLAGFNPLDWVYQFQGIVTLFGLPFVSFDMKFARGANSAGAVSQTAASSTPPTLTHSLPSTLRRRRASGSPALLIAFEFTGKDMQSLIEEVIQADFVATALGAIAGVAEGTLGFVLSSQSINTLATPLMGLDLVALEGMPVIPQGLTVMAAMRLTQPCGNDFCRFVIKYLGDITMRLWANIGSSPMALSFGASLENIILARDNCPGAAGTMYALGRPVLELSSVGMFMVADYDSITYGFAVYLTVDVGNIRGGDDCAYVPTPGETYRFLEPLTFLVQIEITPTTMYLGGAMIGIWTRAFGLDMLHFGNLQLGMGFTAAAGIPAMEAGGELVLGRDCFVRDEAAGGLVENTNASCVGAFSYFGFSPIEPDKLYFAAGFKGLTLETIITVFAPAIAGSLPDAVLQSGFPQELAADGSIVANPEFSYVASPNGATTLTGRHFPGGFFFHGLLNILGFEVRADIIINPVQQIKVNCSIDPISIGGGLLVVQRSAADSQFGPIVDIDVRYGELSPIPNVKVLLAGYVKLLGFSAEAEIAIDNSGYHIFLEQRFLNLFQSSLWIDASWGSIKTASFSVRCEMKDEFSGALAATIQEVLTAVADKAEKDIEAAQAKVDKAKADVDEAEAQYLQLTDQLVHAASAVQAAEVVFDIASAALQTAEDKVGAQQAKVDAAASSVASKKAAVSSAQAELDAAEATVLSKKAALDSAQAKFDTATDAVNAAQTKLQSAEATFNSWVDIVNNNKAVVDSAQASVDSAQAVVNSKKAAVASAQSAVNSAQNTVNSKKASVTSAQNKLDNAKRDCNDKTKEVDKACDCGKVCYYNWKGKKKCKCTNPLYHLCSGLKAAASSLCNLVGGLETSLTLAKSALSAAESVLEAAKTSLNVANAALTLASNSLSVAEVALQSAKAALSAAEVSKAAAKVVFDAASQVLTVANQSLTAAQSSLNVAKAALAAAGDVVSAASTSLNAATAMLATAEAAVQVANMALDAAMLVLASAQSVADAKAVILAGVQTALEKAASSLNVATVVFDAAQGALTATNSFLQGVKVAVKAGTDVGTAIAEMGLNGIIKVVKASWAVTLSVATGGAFSVSIAVSIRGAAEQTFSIHVDFKDLLSAAADLVDIAFDKASDLLG